MPTEQEFQALLKRVEELEEFQASATQGLVNHMEGINTHDKLIIELQQRSKMTVENLMKLTNNLTTYINKQR
jgi:predicted  nucleic acid-binding Zn-ribbon protein